LFFLLVCNAAKRQPFLGSISLELSGWIGYRWTMRSYSLKICQVVFLASLALVLPSYAQASPATEYDRKAATVFAYLAIGEDAQPSTSLQLAQFEDQIAELVDGNYNVLPIPDIINAFKSGKSLPDRTVGLTFDGADKSLLTAALPLLIKHELPFTVFIPADKVAQKKPPYMSWDDLRHLKKTGLVTLGVHPASYGRLTGDREEEIKRQINNSITQVRKKLGVSPEFISFPFGEYDLAYKKIVQSMGFKAAFGQQSGVAYAGDDLHALPRFVLTERYGDIERFRMTANALPFPVKDLSPLDPHLNTLNPAIGFTAPSEFTAVLKDLSCFSSTSEKPELQILNKVRIELRMKEPLKEDRPRINCTLPVAQGSDEEPRWRWLGMLYTISPIVLEKHEMETKKEAASRAAPDNLIADY
jgi:peptidoglycan/xylan/chitin deacetylase (PgdA/CDA1 family)